MIEWRKNSKQPHGEEIRLAFVQADSKVPRNDGPSISYSTGFDL